MADALQTIPGFLYIFNDGKCERLFFRVSLSRRYSVLVCISEGEAVAIMKVRDFTTDQGTFRFMEDRDVRDIIQNWSDPNVSFGQWLADVLNDSEISRSERERIRAMHREMSRFNQSVKSETRPNP